MQYSYDLCGAEPIVRDVPVYAAAAGTLNLGTLLMLGVTAPDSAADMGVAFITAYANGATEAVDALGTLEEKTYETGGTAPSRTPRDTSGVYYGKAIVNPFMVYKCEYSQAASDDIAVTTGNAASTTVTVASIEDNIDAGWVYFPLAAGGAAGKLRAISTVTTNTLVVDSALTTTTSDTLIKIFPVNHRTTDLTSDGTKLMSQVAVGAGVSLHVIENLIQSDSHVFDQLRWITHAGLDSLSNAKFYAELMMLDHIYNPA